MAEKSWARRPPPWRGVAFKISALASALVLGVIVAMAAQLFRQAERGLIAEMTVRAEFFARSVREAIVPKLDSFQLHFQVEQAKREKAVTYAAVLDEKGVVLSHSDPARIGETLTDEFSRAALSASAPALNRARGADGTAVYDLAVPIVLGARRVGTARLGFDRSSLADALRETRRNTALVAAASVLAAVLGTALIVSWIIRPLPKLAAAADEVARGRFGVQVETRARDEIGLLARSFNAMSVANDLLFKSLREEKEKIETIFKDSVEGLVWVDPGGRLRLVNPAAAALLGLGGGGPETLEQAVKGFQSSPALPELLAGERRAAPFEWTRQQPKLLILSGVCDKLQGEGSSAGFLFVFREATLEKRGETLARDFLSIVSHKLRTPLAVVLGYLELLQGDASLKGFQKDAVDKMVKEQNELRREVEKLLTFTVVQSPERIALQKSAVSGAELIESAIKRLRPPKETVELRWEREPAALLSAEADAMLAREALAALIENAYKFNKKPKRLVRVSAAAENGLVRFAVADDGPGIPSEEHPKLFRKFYQIDDDFTGQIPGMGLGLAFVKAVAEAHGGSVGLKSAPGQGSEFWLSLPAASGARDA